MRALVLTAIGELTVESRPDPVPAPGEAALRIHATGVCGSDLHGYTGENGRRVPGQIMGHETVGEVVAVGKGVDESLIGRIATIDPVILSDADAETFRGREQHCPRKRVFGVAPELVSAFAEMVVVPARNVVVLPAEMPPLHGALVEPLAVAVNAVRRGQAGPNDRVLVTGGGPIGQSIVVALREAGIDSVVVTEVDAIRRSLVAELGAKPVDPTAPDAESAIRTALGGAADLAIDAVGVASTLNTALSATREGGRVVLVGMASPRLDLDAYAVTTAERTIIGSFTYPSDAFREAVQVALRHPREMEALIGGSVALDEAPALFARLAQGEGPAGKMLVHVTAR